MKTTNKIKWNSSFKVKLYMMMFFISIVPLLVFGSYYKKALKNEVEDAIHKQHSLIANKASNSVVELVKNLQYSMEVVALINNDTLINGDLKSREELLYGLLKTFPYLEEIKTISTQGEETNKISKRYTVGRNELNNIYNTYDFRVLKLGEVFIGKPNMDKKNNSNNIVFDLGIPVITRGDKFSGAIIAKINLRGVMKEISANSFPEGAYLMLVDEEGSLFGHSDFSQVLRKQDVLESQGVKELILLKKGIGHEPISQEFKTIIYNTYTGEKVLGVYGLIPSVNWGVVVEQPIKYSHRNLEKIIFNTNITILGIIIIILAIGTIFINKFIQPIKALLLGVNQVNLANYSYRIPYKSNDELGRVIEAFNGMIVEIKKRKENEKLIIQAEKSAAIGLLAAGVAHEINNPMNNLGFYVTDLSDRLDQEEINKLQKEGIIKEYLDEILNQIGRCTSITQSLLNFSRESEMKVGNLNINDTIDETLNLLSHRIKKQGLNVIKDYSETYNIYGERSQIQQVLLNILTNAIDSMPNGGDLTITLNRDESSKDFTNIIIKDSGKGIPKDEIPKIFDVFYTTKPIGKGTGLGLSICQEIIGRLRGSINIKSELNKGSEIIIKLSTYSEVKTNGFI